MIAGLGVAGTLTGVIITQRWADSRESRAREVNRAREQERWAREDQVRTFDHRREAYTEFFENIKAMARHALLVNQPDSPHALESAWYEPTFLSLNRLLVFGSAAVAEAAGAAYSACWSWGSRVGEGVYVNGTLIDSRHWEGQYNNLEAALLHAIRDDLQIPGGRLTVIP